MNDQGVPFETTWNLQCSLTLLPSPGTPAQRQRELSSAEAAVRTALSFSGRDFILLGDDGLPTDLSLYNSSLILDLQGLHVVNYSTPVGGVDEYSGRRTINFTVQGTYMNTGATGVVVSYSESVSSIGTGGPTVVNKLTNTGGVRQRPFPQSFCRATQSGTATGYLGYPTFGGAGGAPRYRFPVADLLPDSAGLTKQTAQRRGRIPTYFPVQWNFQYERVGQPFVF